MGPETLALVSLGSTVLGTGVSLIGGMQQAAAQESAANYQAQVARNNQIIAEQNARSIETAAATRAQAEDMQTRALLGTIEAAQGASGISFDSPTMARIRESQAQIGRLESRTTYQEGQNAARGQQQQAAQFGAEVQLASNRAASAGAAGTIGAFSSLLTGASSFSDKWLRFRYSGVPGFAGS